jgi:hypothetical protein
MRRDHCHHYVHSCPAIADSRNHRPSTTMNSRFILFALFVLPARIYTVRASTTHAVSRRGAQFDARGRWQMMLDASRSVLRSPRSLVVCHVCGVQCMPCPVCGVWPMLAIRSLRCMACWWVRTVHMTRVRRKGTCPLCAAWGGARDSVVGFRRVARCDGRSIPQHRPEDRALRQAGIISPWRPCGLTADI